MLLKSASIVQATVDRASPATEAIRRYIHQSIARSPEVESHLKSGASSMPEKNARFAGSVWFYMAYGTYWLWTSKEMWISITWLYVGLYLHARLMTRFRGVPAAVMGVLVFGVALFTYFGVGTVIPSPPTQF